MKKKEFPHFTKVEFRRFKAFKKFDLSLREFNVLVGPNNAGKSTVIAAFRILSAGLRIANRRSPTRLVGPAGRALGHLIDLDSLSIGEENLFYNYDDSEPASVKFKLSGKRSLTLFFPSAGACFLFPDCEQGNFDRPTSFRNTFSCSIGFVPILGPVDHKEKLFGKEAARRALSNYTAARNFRNIWHHYPEDFQEFRNLLRQTWPGMDIEPPEINTSGEKATLDMFCPEERIPREIFWAGFGFQVWCQMLTHLVQSRAASIFLIDEPDIYLHSELQRQLLTILRNLGPDVLIATHSTEIVTEAESDEIVLVDKKRGYGKRIKNPAELASVFSALGSNLNPVLTQLAKTKKAVFVEGKDFQILSKFAQKLGKKDLASRSGFAVIAVGGFNPAKAKNLLQGMQTTLGGEISSAVILDRDFRSEEECKSIAKECETFSEVAIVHSCKEIENFLLAPTALDRAIQRKIDNRNARTDEDTVFELCALELLIEYAKSKETYVTSQQIDFQTRYRKSISTGEHATVVTTEVLETFSNEWDPEAEKFHLLPGKEALSELNAQIRLKYGVNITPAAIIDAMQVSEIHPEMIGVLETLEEFLRKS